VERTLDYIFDTLKISSSSVDHPIIFSELIGNPEYIRQELLELLFKGYGVHKVALVSDIAASFNHAGTSRTGLVVSLGNHFTTVCTIVEGKVRLVKRINYGASQAAETLLKIIQCKHPTFPVKMTLQQAACALQKACLVAEDYLAVLSELESASGIQKYDFCLQFPYPQIDKELEKERVIQEEALKQKRKELTERLRERAAAKRIEKLKNKEDKLAALQNLQRKLTKKPKTESGNSKKRLLVEEEEEVEEDLNINSDDELIGDDEFEELRVHGFDSLIELDEAVLEAEKDLKLYKNKLDGVVEEKEQPNFDLIDIPDDRLTPEQIQEKRKQRLLKVSQDAREKMRLQKEAQARLEEERAKEDEEWRQRDFQSWQQHYYEERQRLLSRIKSRQKQREALTDRRSLASTLRLRNAMSLVDDAEDGQDQSGSSSSKKKRAPKKSSSNSAELELNDQDDGFGENDSDWQIYRQIRRDELSDEEEEEQDQERLVTVETKLEQYDVGFYEVLAEEMSQKATIVDLLRSGGLASGESPVEGLNYQIHLNVERFRVPEILFQPSIAGIDQAGLVEVISHLLDSTDDVALKKAMLSNILLTGGWSSLPGLSERITKDLKSVLPEGTEVHVELCDDAALSAWKGLAGMEKESSLEWITKKDWLQRSGK
jgi:actin-related protein 5